MNILVVQTLPTQDISITTIYLLPRQTSETNNVYDEYIYVSNSWEKIGSTDIDLTGYATETWVNTQIANFLTQAQIEALITTAIAGKQDILVSGTNIKTINNTSILGNGNIEIQGGSGGGDEIFIGDEQDAPASTKLLIDDEYVNIAPNIAEEIYSTEEIKIGKWIDGKPLYRKVVSVSFTTNEWDANLRRYVKDISNELTNTDTTLLKNWYIKEVKFNIPSILLGEADDKWGIHGYLGNNQLSLSIGNREDYSTWGNYTHILIIEYTKTTDIGGVS